MAATAPTSTIRDCAQAIVAAIARHGSDGEELGAAIQASLATLMAMPNLLERGIPREGNNVAFSQYLYYDGELSIIIFEVPKGRRFRRTTMASGRRCRCIAGGCDTSSTSASTTDGARGGRASGRGGPRAGAGDFAIVSPPADIHSFTALDDGTYGITVVSGAYKARSSLLPAGKEHLRGQAGTQCPLNERWTAQIASRSPGIDRRRGHRRSCACAAAGDHRRRRPSRPGIRHRREWQAVVSRRQLQARSASSTQAARSPTPICA